MSPFQLTLAIVTLIFIFTFSILAVVRRKWDVVSSSKLKKEFTRTTPFVREISYTEFINRGQNSPYADILDEKECQPFCDTFVFAYRAAVTYLYMYSSIVAAFNVLGAATHVLQDEDVDLGFFKFQYALDGRFIVTVHMCPSDKPNLNFCCIRFWKRWW